MYRIVITDLEHPTIEPELQVLSAIQAQVTRHDCRTEDDVMAVGGQADALMVGFAPITGRVLAALPRCSIVARYGLGVDMIDVQAATECGVVVTNVPDHCLDEVADHTMALLLAVARKIVFLDKAVRDGRAAENGYWKTSAIASPMFRLSRQTLGIVGLGKIGQRVARRAQAFGMQVLAANDPAVSHADAAALGLTMLPLNEVLPQADYLTFHVPLTKATYHLLDAANLALIKPGATVVNTSRGPVLDEDALVEALENGRLAGAALDVYEQEPIRPDHPLLRMEQVVLTSHAAYFSQDAYLEMKTKTAQAVVDHLQGRVPRYVLNPEVLTSSVCRRPASQQSSMPD